MTVSSESYCEPLGVVSLVLMFIVSGVDFGLVRPSFCKCQRQNEETQAFLITCKYKLHQLRYCSNTSILIHIVFQFVLKSCVNDMKCNILLYFCSVMFCKGKSWPCVSVMYKCVVFLSSSTSWRLMGDEQG